MKIKRLVLSVLAAAGLLCGCSKDGRNEIFKYDISDNPQTLDPQQANERNSDLVIGNVFCGLFRKNADGSLSSGVCTDYDVSEDGLVYNFRLRDDVFWVGEDFLKTCTAEDFVFGFQRLFSPETKAPRAEEYFCIKNSKYIYDGRITDMTLLGVKAISSAELEITLDKPNPRFILTLCDPPAMPCCEEFFVMSRGKYGLSAECTPSNGAFRVRSWHFDPYANEDTDVNNMILSRNYKNAEVFDVCPSGINFFIENEVDFIRDFLSGETDCLDVSNDDLNKIKGEFSREDFQSITCGLILNTRFEPFKNKDFRRALFSLCDSGEIISALPEFEAACGVVPKQVTMLDKSFREIAGGCEGLDYSREKARELFEAAKPELDMKLFTGARIIVPNETALSAVSYIMQEWQREFGFYCVVETLSKSEYKSRLESGDFELAMLEISGKYDSPQAYLEKFRAGNAENYGRYFGYGFETAMDGAAVASDLSRSAALYKIAEQTLIDDGGFLPIYFKNEYFFTDKDVSGVVYDPFTKTIDFTKGIME